MNTLFFGGIIPDFSYDSQQSSRQDDSAIDHIHYINRLWEHSIPVTGSLAEKYIRDCRRISCRMPPDISFYPMLKHNPTEKYYPAMLSAVRDTKGNLTELHRTCLSTTGTKADVVPNKTMLGDCAGNYV